MVMTKEALIAAIAMRLVDRRFLGMCDDKQILFAVFIGDDKVPDNLIAEVGAEIPLTWFEMKLIFRKDLEKIIVSIGA